MPDLNSSTESKSPVLQLAMAAIDAGGGEYVGIQRGVPQTAMPDLILFNDPLTHTTLALAVNEGPITAQSVQAKIALSRHVFRQMKKGNGRTSLGLEAQQGEEIWSRRDVLFEAARSTQKGSGSDGRKTTGVPPILIAPIASPEDQIPTSACFMALRPPQRVSIARRGAVSYTANPCEEEYGHRIHHLDCRVRAEHELHHDAPINEHAVDRPKRGVLAWNTSR